MGKQNKGYGTKAELLKFLLVKKLEIEKTKTTEYTTFKTDITKEESYWINLIELMINKARHEIRIVNTARWP